MINVGIDVHKKMCVSTVKDNSRKILEQSKFANNKQDITAFAKRLKRKYGKNTRAVCESTGNYWMILHDTLEENGIDTALVHPAKVKVIAHARIKDDKVDSEVLADLLRVDMLPESFVPNRYYRDLRNLINTRSGKIGDLTRYKNKIHAILAKYDYDLPTHTTFAKSAIAYIKTVLLR